VSPDLKALADTVYGEASGEPWDGKLAVAYVPCTRARLRKLSIRDACLEPFQFSCWNDKDPNIIRIAKVSPTDPVYLACIAAASAAMSKSQPDPTGGATHYLTLELLKSNPPAWVKAPTMIPVARIGSQQFYREE